MRTFFWGAVLCSYLMVSCHADRTGQDNHDHTHDHAHDHSDHDHHDHSNHSHDDHAHDHELEDGQVELSERQFERLGLKVETITKGLFSQIIKSAGQLEAPTGQEAVMTARSSGIVSFTKKNLTSGVQIGQGEIMAYISDKDIADGELVNRNRLQLTLAEQEYQRARQLMRDSLIAVADFNQARARYDAALLAHQTLASGTSENGVSVISPLAGYLKNILVSEGSYVTAGQAIATVSSTRQIRLRADLPESYASQLPLIQSANFKTADGQSVYDLSGLNGRLVSYARTLDPVSHRLPVYFEFDNTGHLIPGSFVEVYLKTNATEALTVPLEALIEEQGNYAVYIREAAGLYRKQAVQVGASDGASIQILSGLEPGTPVVTKGAYYLKLASMSSAIPHGHAH